jgi:hypothetical protein
MGEAFDQFKGITGWLVEDTMKEAPKKFDRYVRNTLDAEQHELDCKKWKSELEVFQKENPLHPSFDELYGKVTKKRKRKETTKRDTDSQEDDVSDEMDMHE